MPPYATSCYYAEIINVWSAASIWHGGDYCLIYYYFYYHNVDISTDKINITNNLKIQHHVIHLNYYPLVTHILKISQFCGLHWIAMHVCACM